MQDYGGVSSNPEMSTKDKDTSIDQSKVLCDGLYIYLLKIRACSVRNILDFDGKLIKRSKNSSKNIKSVNLMSKS